MINLAMLIEENQGYPCYCSEAKKDPCPNLLDGNAKIGWKVHPYSRIGRTLPEVVVYHWENFGLCCSKECAERVTKSWDGAKPEVIQAHIDKIKKSIEEWKGSFPDDYRNPTGYRSPPQTRKVPKAKHAK
jgi:hypothetical protein